MANKGRKSTDDEKFGAKVSKDERLAPEDEKWRRQSWPIAIYWLVLWWLRTVEGVVWI
jgi:hypothetical protein